MSQTRRIPSPGRLLTVLLPVLMLGSAPGIAAAGTPSEEPTFVLNRVCLYIIHARTGQNRVTLPPLRDGVDAAVMDQVVAGALDAVDRVRTRYTFSDLEVVSQNRYLLQATRSREGSYTYSLRPEEEAVFETGPIRGDLDVDGRNGQPNFTILVEEGDQPLLEVSLLMDPGRPLVLARELAEGEVLFTVVITETAWPAPTPPLTENGFRDRATFRQPAAPETVEPDPDRIYLHWDVPPRLVHSVQPDYPEIARRAGVEGTVVLHITVGMDGMVEEARVVRSTTMGIFDEPACEAVRKWRYEPARVDGRPVRSTFRQTLQFTIPEPGKRF